MQVSRQVSHDSVSQAADLRIEFSAVPGHVEQEDDVVVLIAVKAQYIPTSVQAVLSEEPRQRLEFNRRIVKEGIFFVEVQLIIYDPCDILHYSEVIGERESGIEVACHY